MHADHGVQVKVSSIHGALKHTECKMMDCGATCSRMNTAECCPPSLSRSSALNKLARQKSHKTTDQMNSTLGHSHTCAVGMLYRAPELLDPRRAEAEASLANNKSHEQHVTTRCVEWGIFQIARAKHSFLLLRYEEAAEEQ